MNIDKLLLNKILQPFQRTEKFFDVDISKLSTMKLKSQGHYIVLSLEENLQEVLQSLYESKIPYRMIGWGANQILPVDARDTVYIKLKPPENPHTFIHMIQESYTLPASYPLNVLVSKATDFGFKGWEVLTGIPASLGGAAYMNAGTKFGDISSIIESVYVTNPREKEKKIIVTPSMYTYRKNHFINSGDVITKIEIKNLGIDKNNVISKIHEYLEYRKKTQPLQGRNCGCVFKNRDGVSAGKIIEDLGLKGTNVGGMRVSHLHANFLENDGSATAADFWELVRIIQEKVKDQFGKELELEINS